MAETVVANETYFGDLDAVVGDGYFGYSMARGFEIVLSDWDGFDRTDIATFLKKVAVMITSRIGGTSGPIWGTGFLRAGNKAAGANSLDAAADCGDAESGRSTASRPAAVPDVGDKTLLYGLIPVTDALEERANAGASPAESLRAAAATARSAAEAHPNRCSPRREGRPTPANAASAPSTPDAVAVAVLIEALADEWKRSGTPRWKALE